MTETVRRIRVFVASPGDVDDERSQLARVVQDVNIAIDALAPGTAVLDLLRWETNVRPGFGSGPQSVIDDQLPVFDIFIGMMWNRFGTPTENAGSGTEHEFRRAYAEWAEMRSPELMFYFSKAPSTLETIEQTEQRRKVLEFEQELLKKGLVKPYAGPGEYADVVRRDLLLLVGQLLRRDQPAAAQAVPRATGESSVEVARQFANAVQDLATEYEQVRRDMRSGPERTREMEKIAARMRTLSADAYPMLGEFAHSQSPGVRLAATTFLQTIPDVNYVNWLAERLVPGAERPFVGYHAAVGLLAAARSVDESDLDATAAAIEKARDWAGDHPDRDRNSVLHEAWREVEHRRGSATSL